MRRALALALLLVACRGSSDQRPPPAVPADARAPDAAPAPPPDLSFVRGTVLVVESDGHDFTTRALAGGDWVAVDGGGHNVFPTAVRWQGGILAIATRGEGADDHVEQLAVIRGSALERFGAEARMLRNPGRAGDTLIFESSEASYRDLYRLDGAGELTRLTDNREGNFEPAVSPDGTTVAFASSRDGDSEIYRMPAAGGTATRLTAFHKDEWFATWAPDGKTLAFLSDREGRPRLFAMNPDGTGQHRMTAETTPEAIEDLPRWSPDGKTVAYLRGTGALQTLQLLDPSSGTSRTLTPAGSSDRDLAWSPDGTHLAVIRHPLDGKQLGPPALVFVRLSDNHTTSDTRVKPTQLVWAP